MEAGVVDGADRHPAQDIRKTHVPQNLVRGIGVTGMEGLGNSLVDPSQRNCNTVSAAAEGFWRGSIGTVLVNRMHRRPRE